MSFQPQLPFQEVIEASIKDMRNSLSQVLFKLDSAIANTDGVDSNNNLLDFELGCITPGSSNVAGSGNCSVTTVSAVPVPAAVWLFGSGMLGLMGLARRK